MPLRGWGAEPTVSEDCVAAEDRVAARLRGGGKRGGHGEQQSPASLPWEQGLSPAIWEPSLRDGTAALVHLRLGGQQSWNADFQGFPSQPRRQQMEVLTLSM